MKRLQDKEKEEASLTPQELENLEEKCPGIAEELALLETDDEQDPQKLRTLLLNAICPKEGWYLLNYHSPKGEGYTSSPDGFREYLVWETRDGKRTCSVINIDRHGKRTGTAHLSILRGLYEHHVLGCKPLEEGMAA